MAHHTLFYSWQTDKSDECNRSFIRDAIKLAIKTLQDLPEVEEAPRFDSGMNGIPGAPEVAKVMFDKIESASLFVGDVTLTGTAQRDDGQPRRTPNSNVAIEMGFAAGTLGWERVICIMNTAFGEPEEQPFDVRNRRFPITYKLEPGANSETAIQTKKELVKDLISAFRTAELAELAKVDRVIKRLDIKCIQAISIYGGMDFFAEHSVLHEKLGAAIPRLLDLGLIYTNVANGLYAYHWTYLGKKVIARNLFSATNANLET